MKSPGKPNNNRHSHTMVKKFFKQMNETCAANLSTSVLEEEFGKTFMAFKINMSGGRTAKDQTHVAPTEKACFESVTITKSKHPLEMSVRQAQNGPTRAAQSHNVHST